METTTLHAASSNTTAPRYDIYAAIHRALRMFMTDTLVRVGQLDPDDPVELQAALAQLDRLLATCRSHLEHENHFVHAAIEARRPGGSARIAAEHVGHEAEIAALQAEAATLRAAPGAAATLRLYRRLAVFVGENFAHMQVEESLHNQALWDSHDDAEIAAVEQALVASLPVEELTLVLHWMTRALPPAERAARYAVLARELPPEAFAGLLADARAWLDDRAWGKLSRALALPARPWAAPR